MCLWRSFCRMSISRSNRERTFSFADKFGERTLRRNFLPGLEEGGRVHDPHAADTQLVFNFKRSDSPFGHRRTPKPIALKSSILAEEPSEFNTGDFFRIKSRARSKRTIDRFDRLLRARLLSASTTTPGRRSRGRIPHRRCFALRFWFSRRWRRTRSSRRFPGRLPPRTPHQ